MHNHFFRERTHFETLSVLLPYILCQLTVQDVNHSDGYGDHFTKWQPFVQKLSDIDACLYVFTVNV